MEEGQNGLNAALKGHVKSFSSKEMDNIDGMYYLSKLVRLGGSFTVF